LLGQRRWGKISGSFHKKYSGPQKRLSVAGMKDLPDYGTTNSAKGSP
jgi:hypothetical protein